MEWIQNHEETGSKEKSAEAWEIVQVDILENGFEMQQGGKPPFRTDFALVHVQFGEGSPTVLGLLKKRNQWLLDLFATGDVWSSMRPLGLSESDRPN